jgi:quercetin dioxygenase-like cupin family protein
MDEVVFNFNEMISYQLGSVVSRQIIKNDNANITLFAFDKHQILSEHTTAFDALVQVLDGQAELTIGDVHYLVNANQAIILPANVPHAVKAITHFKMLLTMIR